VSVAESSSVRGSRERGQQTTEEKICVTDGFEPAVKD